MERATPDRRDRFSFAFFIVVAFLFSEKLSAQQQHDMGNMPMKMDTVKKKPVQKKTTKKTTTAKKAPAKKSPAKKAAPKKSGAKRKPNAAFMKAMTPSATLGAVVGTSPLPRTEVTKKIWDYIKKNRLQDAVNRRLINADDKLRAVFGGKSKVSMFEMTKLVSNHLK